MGKREQSWTSSTTNIYLFDLEDLVGGPRRDNGRRTHESRTKTEQSFRVTAAGPGEEHHPHPLFGFVELYFVLVPYSAFHLPLSAVAVCRGVDCVALHLFSMSIGCHVLLPLDCPDIHHECIWGTWRGAHDDVGQWRGGQLQPQAKRSNQSAAGPRPKLSFSSRAHNLCFSPLASLKAVTYRESVPEKSPMSFLQVPCSSQIRAGKDPTTNPEHTDVGRSVGSSGEAGRMVGD
jgi:hypothetical protein